MNIVKPYAKIMPDINLNVGVMMLKKVEQLARISHRSEERMGPNSWERFIPFVVLQKGDWSVTEHAIVTVEAVVDRGITHEWVRHRIGSYTQESTRFVNYEKGMPPSFINPFSSLAKEDVLHPYKYEQADRLFNDIVSHSERAYKAFLEIGFTPQIARGAFVHWLASKIGITYNLRMWRHFFLMRTTKETHPQMREVSIPLLMEFKNNIPFLYDDIVPEQSQAHNLKLPDGDNAKDGF